MTSSTGGRRGVSSLVRDADRAGRVVRHGVADRAERHSLDAAAAAPAYHEHLGLGLRCGRKQRGTWRAAGDLPLDGYLGMLLFGPGDLPLEVLGYPACAAQAPRSAATCELTDPSSNPASPPRPRVPTTTISAPPLHAHSAAAAGPD